MALYLDSASLDDARAAASYGFVTGVTTNPALFHKAGVVDGKATIEALTGLFLGTVFYQLTAHTMEEMRSEARAFTGIAPNVGLKIPCTLDGLKLTAELSRTVAVAVTSVFSPSQAYLAAVAGARYVIPYVNRVTRYTGDGPGLVSQLAAVIEPTACEILAASIKSPAEAVDAILAGAHHVSVPLEVIHAILDNGLTQQAIAEFDAVLPKAS